MVKNGLIRLLCLQICFIFALSASACSFDPNEQVTHVQYYTEATPLMNHIDGIDDYDSLEYEAVVRTTRLSMGPHEPEYRGIIVLPEDSADDVWNRYEWNEANPVVLEFEKIETDDLNSDTWYYSEEFKKDTIKYGHVNYIYINGNTVIFSFQTT
ncbi:MAG: hypothetical protein K5779_01325 [Saccharofermentans sp.]|nr:hypothetical protein [Saccharofermentans sp.]